MNERDLANFFDALEYSIIRVLIVDARVPAYYNRQRYTMRKAVNEDDYGYQRRARPFYDIEYTPRQHSRTMRECDEAYMALQLNLLPNSFEDNPTYTFYTRVDRARQASASNQLIADGWAEDDVYDPLNEIDRYELPLSDWFIYDMLVEAWILINPDYDYGIGSRPVQVDMDMFRKYTMSRVQFYGYWVKLVKTKYNRPTHHLVVPEKRQYIQEKQRYAFQQNDFEAIRHYDLEKDARLNSVQMNMIGRAYPQLLHTRQIRRDTGEILRRIGLANRRTISVMPFQIISPMKRYSKDYNPYTHKMNEIAPPATLREVSAATATPVRAFLNVDGNDVEIKPVALPVVTMDMAKDKDQAVTITQTKDEKGNTVFSGKMEIPEAEREAFRKQWQKMIAGVQSKSAWLNAATGIGKTMYPQSAIEQMVEDGVQQANRVALTTDEQRRLIMGEPYVSDPGENGYREGCDCPDCRMQRNVERGRRYNEARRQYPRQVIEEDDEYSTDAPLPISRRRRAKLSGYVVNEGTFWDEEEEIPQPPVKYKTKITRERVLILLKRRDSEIDKHKWYYKDKELKPIPAIKVYSYKIKVGDEDRPYNHKEKTTKYFQEIPTKGNRLSIDKKKEILGMDTDILLDIEYGCITHRDAKIKDLPMNIKYFSRFAMELTYMPAIPKAWFNQKWFTGCDSITQKIASLAVAQVTTSKQHYRKLFDDETVLQFDKGYSDSGSLEIPTTIYDDYPTFRKMVSRLQKQLKQMCYVPSSRTDYIEEGGCHINFDGDRLQELNAESVNVFVNNVFDYVAHHPSLVWAMLNSYDNESSAIDRKYSRDSVGRGAKGGALNFHHASRLKRMELRFFTMPLTLREMDVHFEFSNKLLLYIYRQTFDTVNGVAKQMMLRPKQFARPLKEYTYKIAVTELEAVCDDIGYKFSSLVAIGKLDAIKDRIKLGDEYMV